MTQDGNARFAADDPPSPARPTSPSVTPSPAPSARSHETCPREPNPFYLGVDVETERTLSKPSRPRLAVRICATALFLAVGMLSTLVIWDAYVTAPWTRDGRARVQVANVAPLVSGLITDVRVVDNQFVHAGDLLYLIDPFDFRVALAAATAEVKQRTADLDVKRRQSERRLRLNDLATTPEEQQVYSGQATDAEALQEAAVQRQAQAEIYLARTQVRSPVNGFVTNLLMRVGDYAHAGVTNAYVIDTDSYGIDGYFKETKLARLCVGDRVEAKATGI